MTKVLVLYYSMYRHIETMAKAAAEGARCVEGAEVTIKRVPDLVPEDVARKSGAKLDQARRSRRWTNFRITTPLSSVRRHVSVTCVRRSVIFSTGPAGCG